VRVIEKLKKEIADLEKEREKLREKILEEIAKNGYFTLKKEREITYKVEEEDEDF
jgi:cell division protein FtsB